MTNNLSNEKNIPIQIVAERIGRSVDTIGRWQRQGHVTPEYKVEAGSGILKRFFSEQDIVILEAVREQNLKRMISGVGEESVTK